MQEKQSCMISFFLSIFDFFCRFASILDSKIFTVGKYCNYPLTTTLGDRFESCENIVSRSQTSSLPPPGIDREGIERRRTGTRQESIVNNRPITAVSDDPEDCSALTPYHFILQRATQLPPGVFVKEDSSSRKRWRKV